MDGLFLSKSNESLSLNETVKMYGVEIKKMPCGKYFEALQTLKNLPEDFIQELSDNKQDFRLSEMLSLDNLINLITKLLMIAPKFLFSFLSKLLDIEEEYIKNELSPTELVEICKKFWDINNLESFFDQMRPAIKSLMTLTGFKK